MKITHIAISFPGGGKEKRLLQLIQGMKMRGYSDIQLIFIDNLIDYPDIYDTNIRIDIVNATKKTRNPFVICKKLHNFISDFQPDIVQVWGMLAALYVDFAFMKIKFKYILSYVADCNKPAFFSVENLINLLSIPRAHAVVGNSNAGLVAYSIPSRKAHCIYNGYNEARQLKVQNLDILTKKKQLNIGTRYVISMVGRVCEHKDYDTYIEVARKILSKRKDVTFLAIGKGDLLQHYKDMLSKQEIEYIRFLGFRDDTDELLKISNISVLCTNFKKHQEGISNAILESMYLGVPVVATYGGGTPEIIADGINGFLIKGNNIHNYVEKIELLLNNKNLHKRFSTAAIMKVTECFSLEQSVNAYLDLYNNLCSEL